LPDDDELNALPSTTLSWLSTQINKDEEEEFEKLLSFCEYLASFINHEAVRNVQENRANRKTTADDEFEDLLKNISGRSAPKFKGRE